MQENCNTHRILSTTGTRDTGVNYESHGQPHRHDDI